VRENLSPKSLGVRPGNTLVAVHDPTNLSHLVKVLDENNPNQTDVVVVSVNADCPDAESEDPTRPEEVINACETKIFSKVVYVGEKAGKPAHLIAVPGKEVYELILIAANRLRSSRVVMSLSQTVGAEEQGREIAQAWENLPRPRPELHVEIMPDGEENPWKIDLGRHLVLPSAADQDIAHRLWWELSQTRMTGVTLHEGDVFGIALRHLDEGLRSGDVKALNAIEREILLRESAGSKR
jgi:hypothetical protein